MITTVLLTLIAGAEPRVTGGVMAPASLPAGTNALYGFVGAPELGVGYRQGFGLVEFEARGVFVQRRQLPQHDSAIDHGRPLASELRR